MSVLDELTKLEKDVRERMMELRPLLDEYAELEKAAKRLGIDAVETTPASASKTEEPARRSGAKRRAVAKPRRQTPVTPDASSTDADPGASATPAEQESTMTSEVAGTAKPAAGKRSRPSATGKPRRRAESSRPGERAEELAGLVQQRPGLTVKEAGDEFKVDPTSLYRVIKKLESDGRLVKRGRELHPA